MAADATRQRKASADGKADMETDSDRLGLFMQIHSTYVYAPQDTLDG